MSALSLSLPPALFLMGPTASGKTALAIELSQRGPFDIISVDSGMVYRGMDIGTAKPDAETLAKAPHQLIDIRDPKDAYSAADFRRDALAAMAKSAAQGRVPLLVGGTMLYYRVLLDGLADMPDADADIRAQIEADAAANGWPAIHAQLAEIDPVAAARLKPNDSQRVQRALEVYRLTGKPLSDWHAEQAPAEPLPYAITQWVLAPSDRALLHERIAQRFDVMLKAGLVDEVARLRDTPSLHRDLPSMRAVGYAQVWDYLDGAISFEEMRLRGIYATRQLAKRQFTWLRRFDEASWFEPSTAGLADRLLKEMTL